MRNRTPDVGSPGAWYQLVRLGELGRIAVGVMSTTVLGIDLGKRWFHMIGKDEAGHITHRQKLYRGQLIQFCVPAPA